MATFDADGSGDLDRAEFDTLINTYQELLNAFENDPNHMIHKRASSKELSAAGKPAPSASMACTNRFMAATVCVMHILSSA